MAPYISRVVLENVRSFGTLELDMARVPDGSSCSRLHTVVIGENGTGKTTLLRAIAVGLADKKDASGLLAEPTGQFVAEDADTATINIELVDSETKERHTLTTVIANQDGQDVLHSKGPDSPVDVGLVCGYGISRAYEGADTGRAYRLIDSVYTLFLYGEQITGTELALRRLKDFLGVEWYPPAMERIKAALGLDSEVSIELVRGGGVVVSGPGIGKRIPLEGWADGYSKTLAWILDFHAWAMRAKCITSAGNVTGILLLDELEEHIHPSMQVELSSRLSTLFPDVQVIGTTHSPLVALGVRPEELVVLKRDRNQVSAVEEVRDFHGYSVEDMYADSELFDAPTYNPEVTEKLRRYRELASKPSSRRSSDEQTELERLGSELASQQIPELWDNPALAKLQAILRQL